MDSKENENSFQNFINTQKTTNYIMPSTQKIPFFQLFPLQQFFNNNEEEGGKKKSKLLSTVFFFFCFPLHFFL